MDALVNTENTPRRSHKKLIVTLAVVAALLAAPFVPALVCEISTARHLDEFVPMMNDYDDLVSKGWKFKIIEYSDSAAKIYRYINKGDERWGEIHGFFKQYGEWNYSYPEWVNPEWDDADDYLEQWDSGWDFKTNTFVPQYWWHFFTMCLAL